MRCIVDLLNSVSADDVSFWILQGALIVAFVVALLGETIARGRAGKGGAMLRVGRGAQSMAIFYGSYVAISGLLIAVCLQIDVIESHRIFWILLDTLIPFYFCVLNSWSRNIVLGWADKLTRLETR